MINLKLNLKLAVLMIASGYAITCFADNTDEFSVSVPADAEFVMGTKSSHYVTFTTVEPLSVETSGNTKTLRYQLSNAKVYNYRTWINGGLTQAGYFTMSTDALKRPDGLAFTSADYQTYSPKSVNHSYSSNLGFETGNILVNINERGHLKLNVGDSYDAHAMRSWQLIDNVINNYFFEPDFHYTVLDINGNPSTDVIEIDNANTSTDAWSTIKAVGKGTAIVLVTYDAIKLNYYSTSGEKKAYSGGEYWGAIWPENTAVYVVTVGADESTVNPNMTINVGRNEADKKIAGDNIDAEHDVFYYLDTDDGFKYTFKPENVEKVELAYPSIGENAATYNGFSTNGVTMSDDGSYTILLKQGRQIAKLSDKNGNAIYQVLTAQPCEMEIKNATRSDDSDFKPGDEVKIQFNGLTHPANKLAGIYNMKAEATYQTMPESIALTTTANQYTFGNTQEAQAVTFTIPEDYAASEIKLSDGAIATSYYGDPFGNHRLISRQTGRNPNFAAVMQNAVFGILPNATIKINKDNQAGVEDFTTIEKTTITGYYNMNGQRLKEPQRGLNIVVMSDGSVKKQLVK